MKKVAAYIRVSTEDQAREERGGIPGQQLRIQRAVERFELAVVRTFTIIDVSGKNVWHSPIFKEFLDFIKADEIEGVVIADEFRLIRPGKREDLKIIDYLTAARVTIYTPEREIDPDSLGFAVTLLMGGEDRKRILSVMNAAKEAMRRAGKHVGGGISYGVNYDPKTCTWSYDLSKAPKIRKIFRLFLSGESYEQIARVVNLPRTTVQYILQNPIYTGWRVLEWKRDPSPDAEVMGVDGHQGYRRKMRRVGLEVHRSHVIKTGLIRQKDFDTAQALIRRKREMVLRQKTGVSTALTTYRGFLYCGDPKCGCRLYTTASQTGLFYYCKSQNKRERERRALAGLKPCSNRHMLRRKIEATLDKIFGRKFRSSSFLANVIRELRRRFAPNSSKLELKRLLRAVSQLNSKRERVLETYYDGKISKQERDEKLLTIDREMAAQNRLIAGAQACVSAQSILDVRTLQSVLSPLLGWEQLCTEDKRRILISLLPEIVIFRYEIKEIRFPLASLLKNSDALINVADTKITIPIHA